MIIKKSYIAQIEPTSWVKNGLIGLFKINPLILKYIPGLYKNTYCFQVVKIQYIERKAM